MNKFFWCKSALGEYLNTKCGFNIVGIKKCKYGPKCKGSHNNNDIVEKNRYKKWRESKKTNFDLKKYYSDIISVINKNKDSIQVYKFKSKLQYINDMNIVELFIFWEEMNYHYERFENNTFLNIDNKEDLILFIRTLKTCNDYQNMMKNTKAKTHISKLCSGGINCNRGVHMNKYRACVDDILYGKCKCMSLAEFNEKKNTLHGQELNKLINSRLHHYTEYGMKPFNYVEPVVEPVNVIEEKIISIEFKPVIRIEKLF